MTNFGLSDKTCHEIKQILAHYKAVKRAILYGSRAMGTYHEGSDIDLTLEGHELDLRTLNAIANDLDDSFLPYTFDLSIYHTLQNDDIKDHIARVGVVFYEGDSP